MEVADCRECCADEGASIDEAALRRAVRLEWFTILYNVAEGVAAIAFGVIASSIALVGFGIDSGIEVAAAGVVLWRLKVQLGNGDDAAAHEAAEQKALRVVGVTFFLLCGYILYESIGTLVEREPPAESVAGIVLAVLSLIIMPLLAFWKRQAARAVGSDAMRADSVQTAVCGWLSFALLLGLVLNATVGWWWADPVAALAMVPLLVKEGTGALRGESCGC